MSSKMGEYRLNRISRFLSLVLRHKPESIGLSLDSQGWVQVDELLAKAQQAGRPISLSDLETVVRLNDKQRFRFSEDGARIRASQGHSIPVDLGLAPVAPPRFLYHGTAQRFIESIRKEGLVSRGRQYVHLSMDERTAANVGKRHGKPVVLTIESKRMHADGYPFYLSDNGIWLTGHIPEKYILFPSEKPA